MTGLGRERAAGLCGRMVGDERRERFVDMVAMILEVCGLLCIHRRRSHRAGSATDLPMLALDCLFQGSCSLAWTPQEARNGWTCA